MQEKYYYISSSGIRTIAGKCRFCGVLTCNKNITQCRKCGTNNRRLSATEYFNKHTNKTTSCWLWTGTIKRYGVLHYQGRQWRAHRFSWLIFKGEIPDGLYVCHHCDNKICVRPSHLFLGTAKDNFQDMLKKGRANYPKGESHFNAKLTTKRVKWIRAQRRYLGECRDYAKKFNLSKTTIGRIINNKIWKHV